MPPKPYVPAPTTPGMSAELGPNLRVLQIPEDKRNGFEKEYAQAALLLKQAAEIDCSTKAGAVLYAKTYLAARNLTLGTLAINHVIRIKHSQAARYVERYTMRRYILENTKTRKPASDDVIRTLISSERPKDINLYSFGEEAVYQELAAQSLMPLIQLADEDFSTDDAALVMVAVDLGKALGCTDALREFVELFHYVEENAQVVHKLLPSLEGQAPGLMSATDWRALWSLEAGFACSALIQTVERYDDDWWRYLRAMQSLAAHVSKLWPRRPLAHSLLTDAFNVQNQVSKAIKYSRLTQKLSDEQGNDFGSALARWLTANFVILGADGPHFQLKPVVEMAMQAQDIEKRLDSWGMLPFLKIQVSVARDNVKGFLKVARKRGFPQSATLPAHPLSACGPPPPPMRFLQPTFLREETLPDGSTSVLEVVPPAAAPAAQGAGAGTSGAAAGQQQQQEGCNGCGQVYLEYKKCGQCKQRRYCSQECQAKDWKAGHKRECKKLAEAAAGQAATK